MGKAKSWREILMQPKSLPEFLIEPQVLARAGSMIIYGSSGSGKSWMGLDMIETVSLGEKWLGIYPTRASICLLLQAEQPESLFNQRVVKLQKNRNGSIPDHAFILNTQDIHLDNPSGTSQLESEIREIHPALLVIDNLSQVIASINDEGIIKSLTNFLDRIKSQYSCAVVLIHHPRKMGDEDEGYEEMAGHSRLNRWADIVIRLRGVQPNPIVLEYQKQNRTSEVVQDDIRLEFDRQTGKFKFM